MPFPAIKYTVTLEQQMVDALSNEDTVKIVKHKSMSIRDKIKRVWVSCVVVLA